MKDFELADIRKSGASTTRVLSDILSEQGVSVADFGAVADGGSGSPTDNLQAFLDAGEYLLARGGGVLYVPPTLGANNYYRISATLNFADCPSNTENSFIYMEGGGALDNNGSRIVCDTSGHPVIQHDFGKQLLRGIKRIGITNGAVGGLGIQWNGTHVGEIAQCKIYANGCGIYSNTEGYQLAIDRCDIYGSGNQGIGVSLGQNSVSHTSIVGWDVGARFFNVGGQIEHTRFEVNKTGVQLGLTLDACITVSGISGTTMTVSAVHGGGFIFNEATHGGLCTVSGGMHLPIGIVRVLSQLTGTTGSTGTYQISETLTRGSFNATTGRGSQITAMGIRDLSFERNNVSVDVIAASALDFSSTMISGTTGVGRDVANLSWSGGTVTVTTDEPHYQSGTFLGGIDQATPQSGYDIENTTCTVTGANTFTYALVSNPGVYTGTDAQWSNNIPYGMRIKGLAPGSMSAIAFTISNATGAALDLQYDGNTSTYVTINAITFAATSGGIDAPPGNQKATFFFDGEPLYELLFNELPGQAGGPTGWGADLGMEYNVSDGSTATFGATVTGGGANRVKVRYNGANWTCMGA
jgi:hypothetical protein